MNCTNQQLSFCSIGILPQHNYDTQCGGKQKRTTRPSSFSLRWPEPIRNDHIFKKCRKCGINIKFTLNQIFQIKYSENSMGDSQCSILISVYNINFTIENILEMLSSLKGAIKKNVDISVKLNFPNKISRWFHFIQKI